MGSRFAIACVVLLTLGALFLPSPMHAPVAPVGRPAPGLPASVLSLLAPAVTSLAPRPTSSDRAGPLAVPNANGTPTWTDLAATAGAPPPRISGGLAYDGEDGYTILFGGEYLNTSTFAYQYYSDTWEFSGGKWSNITGTVHPSARFGFGIAFDPTAGEVILFGGRNAQGVALNDTWEFSGGTWSNITSTPAPSPRFWPSMGWDSTTNNIVLFGGVSATSSDLNDTWTFAAGTWSEAAPATHPSSRHGATLTDDPSEKALLLFGGLGAQYFNDTWWWTAGDWIDESGSLGSVVSPDARVGAGAAYDTALGQTVLYGGNPANTYPAGTWLYSSLNWTLDNNLPGSPPSDTVWDQLTYDAADAWTVYLVPNSNETFVFNETSGGGASPLQVTPSAAPLSGVVPLTVTLSATISGGTAPYTVTWTTGDMTTVHVQNSSVTYSTPGAFDLTLWVNDSASGRYVDNWTVHALAGPLQATAVGTPGVAAVAQSVAFNATYSGGSAPYAFDWSFGDGTHATTENASHAYAAAATYDVSFEVTASIGGSKFVNFTERVEASVPPLTVTASVTPTDGVVALLVNGTSVASGGEPPYAYLWSWGDANAYARAANASHTYATGGIYSVALNVSDSNGSSVRKTWTVVVTPAVSVTIVATPTMTQVGAPVAFSSFPAGGTPPYTYAWSFGAGLPAVTTPNTTHAFSSPGTYTVTLTVTDSAHASAQASVAVSVTNSSAGGSGQSGLLSSSEWLALIVILLVIAILIIVLATRRRRKPTAAVTPGT